MLEEFKEVRQRPGEGYRRFFSSGEFDLMVWYREKDGELTGFQICYDKGREEKAITYKADEDRVIRSHRFVSGGVTFPHGSNMTAVLSGNAGKVSVDDIVRIRREVDGLEDIIIDFVQDQLKFFV